MKTLFEEYQELLDQTINIMKKDYPDFIIYTASIYTDDYNNLTTISFDNKENALKNIKENNEFDEEEYNYWIEHGELEMAELFRKSEQERVYNPADFKLHIVAEWCHESSLENWHEVLKKIGKIAFDKIKLELNIDLENFELGINSLEECYDESWNIKDMEKKI